METKIYNSYSEFLDREDQSTNGVSVAFAENNPNYAIDNQTNEYCWNCHDCRDCSGCRGCSGCSGCSDCSDIYFKYNINSEKASEPKLEADETPFFAGMKIPIIKNIHQEILKAVTPPENKLAMNTWHTCGTTHCRAGWAVHLAGKEGYELEKIGGTCFAAMMIFKYSNPNVRISPVRFFEDNETALRDIKKCAAKEKELNKKKTV